MKKVLLLLGIIIMAYSQVYAGGDLEGAYKEAKGDWVEKGINSAGKTIYGCTASSAICYRMYANGAFAGYEGGNIVYIGDWYSIGPAGTGGVGTEWGDLDEEFDGSSFDVILDE